jgi:hypothetical protein
MSDAADVPTDARPYWHLTMACRKCGAKGLVPWDRLDRVLCCRRCLTRYRVGAGASGLTEIATADSDLQIAVRGSFTEWRQHRLHPRDWANNWLARGGSIVARLIEAGLMMNWPARLALAGGTAALLLAIVLLLARPAPEPPAATVALPSALVERAPLFAAAWLDRDMPQMLRLTDKAQDRQLRQWSGKTPPPLTATVGRAGRKIEAAIEHRDPHGATVAVRIAMSTRPGPVGEFVQHQHWVEKDGGWYFLPALPAAPAPRRR